MPPTTARVTVTLPTDLVEQIDRVETNRSRFISLAVEHEIERRRREGLLTSIRSPHPESVELAAEGMEEWGAVSADGDSGLVDASRGTAVKWEDGRGWVSGAGERKR
jgi:post-segregation antitoxin (ccd killing protein)